LDEFTVAYVFQRWTHIQAYFRGLDFLLNLNLPPGLVAKVWSTFGDDVEAVLAANPWGLVKVDGITFQQADEVAQRMGLDLGSPERTTAAVLGVCKNQKSFGHLYMTTGQLYGESSSQLQTLTHEDFAKALVACHKDKALVVERNVRPGVTAVYEPWFWQIEKEGANLLLQRMLTAALTVDPRQTADYIHRLSKMGQRTQAAEAAGGTLTEVAVAALDEWQATEHLHLSDNQKLGVINALTQPVSVLTGLPGTGKTTSLRAAVKILQEAGIKFLLCAPTGIAAKNLGSLTGAPAYTIHRAFAAKGSRDKSRESNYTGIIGDSDHKTTVVDKDGEWGYGPSSPYPAEVIIVDEASMVDQHLLYRLMVCSGPQTRLVFVGDAAQLPSVGPGNVLRELIKSKRFPVVNLIEIFRQKDTSAIVFAAHAIYRGEMPECEPPSDFSLLRVQSEDQVLQVILKLASKLFLKRANFQILSPRHSGVVGVTNLNSKLRDLLNPSNSSLREIRIGDDTVREDDRVMVIRNDYEMGVFNGDVGKVSRIDNRAKEIELKIFGDPVLYVQIPFKDAAETIRLAYACTVHKAQGLEYDIIVMPVVESFRHQLQRNLFYTAVTRARHKVFLVGSHTALQLAVANDREDQRNTLLRDRLMVELPLPVAAVGVGV
jgi:exodeoxyribonuclease V alpha subunit